MDSTFEQKAQDMHDQYEYDNNSDELNPSAVMDTGATYGAGAPKDGKALVVTGEKSSKVFLLPRSEKVEATEKMRLDPDLRDPATEMNMAPGLHTSLISIIDMVDADYVTMFTKECVKVYNGTTTRILVSDKATIEGYMCTKSGLWSVPLKPQSEITNDDTETILINRPNSYEAITHVFELSSIKKSMIYMHAAAGLSTKETWTKTIKAGNYATWPSLSVKAVNIS